MITRIDVLQKLQQKIQKSGHLIGISTASGMIVKEAGKYNIDFILLSISGLYRNMGNGSLAGFLPYGNSNEMLEKVGEAIIRLNASAPNKIPIMFGLNASDPTIDLEQYLDRLIAKGYAGINNYPTLGLIDGSFSDFLEDSELCFEKEVDAIRLARQKNFFTVAYVFTPDQAEKMTLAGADIICAHLGLTKGGHSSNISSQSIHASISLSRNIFKVVSNINPQVICMIYSGPVSNPIDIHYFYDNVTMDGYIGGAAFDRIPMENFFLNTVKAIQTNSFETDHPELHQNLNKQREQPDYIEQTKHYIKDNFMKDISVSNIADTLNISRTRLSDLFKKEMGITLSQYIIRYRMKKACEILQSKNLSIYEVANLVGYEDYAHFSKSFKKNIGITPKEYKQQFYRP